MKPTVSGVKGQLDQHEAVCAARWGEAISRIKRMENVMLGCAGSIIILLLSLMNKT